MYIITHTKIYPICIVIFSIWKSKLLFLPNIKYFTAISLLCKYFVLENMISLYKNNVTYVPLG